MNQQRTQAIADGTLIDVSETAREAGILCPVAITSAAWADFVAWDSADNKRKNICNDQQGRLWDVLWLLKQRSATCTSPLLSFPLMRVPRNGRGRVPRVTHVQSLCGPGDNSELVITIMLPSELANMTPKSEMTFYEIMRAEEDAMRRGNISDLWNQKESIRTRQR
jgi:hypothetical protein